MTKTCKLCRKEVTGIHSCQKVDDTYIAKEFCTKNNPVKITNNQKLYIYDDGRVEKVDYDKSDGKWYKGQWVFDDFDLIAILEKWLREQLQDGGKNSVHAGGSCWDYDTKTHIARCTVYKKDMTSLTVLSVDLPEGSSYLEILIKAYEKLVRLKEAKQ